MRTKFGRVGFRVLGTQQCIVVPSPRSVTVDRSPEVVKADLMHQLADAVKLKHLDIPVAGRSFKYKPDRRYFWVSEGEDSLATPVLTLPAL